MKPITPETEAALKQLRPELEICPRCRCCELTTEECENCGGEGTDGHDCGEDSCCCSPFELVDNVPCDFCNGRGYFVACLGRCDSEGKHDKR